MEFLKSLRKEHPRLIFLKEDEARLKEEHKGDEVYARLVSVLLRVADGALDAPVIEYKKTGRRLLFETRDSLSRIAHLAMAYRLTGKEAYLERAEKEMLAAAALPDWNPSHFLDVAEMCAGMAIGYDWLYHDLSETARITIRNAVVEKGFKPGFPEGKEPWWVKRENNWNQVCHTGLAMAALAMAEDEPEWAERAVSRAVENIPIVMKCSYEPDGVYPEGPSYWGYGTLYNVLLIASLDSALGRDFGFSQRTGFKESAFWRLLVVGPDGKIFNFSDCSLGNSTELILYWFSRKFAEPGLAWLAKGQHEKAFLALSRNPKAATGRDFPFGLIWYSAGKPSPESLPLDYLGRGPNPIALFRSSWENDALWLAVKGGNNENSHNHMDAGQFVIVAGGVRWSMDLGADDYTKLEQLPPKLWGEGRYDFFRLGVQGHSTLMLNGQSQEIKDSASDITAFYSSPERSHAVIDVSKPWKKEAEKVLRGVAMLDKRSFLVQDEVTGARGEILWQMICPEEIKLDGGTATLSKGGKSFTLKILSPANARFEQGSVKPKYDEENHNKGFGKLLFRVPGVASTQTLAVQMWLEEGESPKLCPVLPLAEWITR